MTSILDDVKHALGIPAANTAFDGDVMIFINSAFSTLTQLGVGAPIGFQITSKENQWEEFFTDPRLNSVKSFVILKVKMAFDPPQSGFVTEAMKEQIRELEYRMNVVADYG